MAKTQTEKDYDYIMKTIAKMQFGDLIEIVREALKVERLDLFNAHKSEGNELVYFDVFQDLFNALPNKLEPLYTYEPETINQVYEIIKRVFIYTSRLPS